jgi:hypothetical protein
MTRISVLPLAMLGLILTLGLAAAVEPEATEKDAMNQAKPNQQNRLANEKSPYLLQHKNNPVNWYPWGQEAFDDAKEQNKPIFLSIGYSTCYWCHVMEKESFERQDVADVLNENFISIKVDREERPDVDQIYMDAVMALSGNGGWPMSVFLNSDLEPFYGGTYFPREVFLNILGQITQKRKEDPKLVDSASEQLMTLLKRSRSYSGDAEDLTDDLFKKVLVEHISSFDSQFGGFGPPPKFPQANRLRLLLRIHRRSGAEQALEMVLSTLTNMAYGGIYDHLDGGFSRYSTDAKWLVPHFEKMLYDNAELTLAYLEAYQATKMDVFASVARETLDYVISRMTADKGSYYSAEDAGEVGKEGEFYVWKFSELERLLNDSELVEIKRVYGVSEEGNFEHANILNLPPTLEWSVKETELLKSIHKKLSDERAKRERPHLDDKTLTAWNGLMIGAMAKAARVLDEPRYLESAKKAALFAKNKLFDGEKLYRRYRDGEIEHNGVLDDYAFLIDGLIALFEADSDRQWLDFATKLQGVQDELFWDAESAGYFYSVADDASLIIRKKEFNDGALPSANGVSALNLLKFYHLSFERRYLERAESLMVAAAKGMERIPSAFASMLIALDYHHSPAKEVVVVAKEGQSPPKDLLRKLEVHFAPNMVLAVGEPAELKDESALPVFRGKQAIDGKTTIYVCEAGICKLPTHDAEKAIELIDGIQKF